MALVSQSFLLISFRHNPAYEIADQESSFHVFYHSTRSFSVATSLRRTKDRWACGKCRRTCSIASRKRSNESGIAICVKASLYSMKIEKPISSLPIALKESSRIFVGSGCSGICMHSFLVAALALLIVAYSGHTGPLFFCGLCFSCISTFRALLIFRLFGYPDPNIWYSLSRISNPASSSAQTVQWEVRGNAQTRA